MFFIIIALFDTFSLHFYTFCAAAQKNQVWLYRERELWLPQATLAVEP